MESSLGDDDGDIKRDAAALVHDELCPPLDFFADGSLVFRREGLNLGSGAVGTIDDNLGVVVGVKVRHDEGTMNDGALREAVGEEQLARGLVIVAEMETRALGRVLSLEAERVEDVRDDGHERRLPRGGHACLRAASVSERYIPETRNPKPETLNPKPLNPKPFAFFGGRGVL